MAAANKNQTRAAKAVAGSASGAVALGDGLRLLTPLNSGRHAYINSGGRSLHLATSGDAFLDAVRELVAAGQEAKIRGELAALAQEYPQDAWPAVRDRVEAELFAAAEQSADEDDTEAA